MNKAILATKVGMTQIFNENGVLTPVTVLQAGPCYVTQVKTVDNDGYSAVQVGFVDKKDKVITKDASGKKEIKRSHGVNKSTHSVRKSKLISLKQATRSMQQELQKVKDSRVQSRDMVFTEDLWDMVLSSTDTQVQMELVQIRAVYSRVRRCLVRWVQ